MASYQIGQSTKEEGRQEKKMLESGELHFRVMEIVLVIMVTSTEMKVGCDL